MCRWRPRPGPWFLIDPALPGNDSAAITADARCGNTQQITAQPRSRRPPHGPSDLIGPPPQTQGPPSPQGAPLSHKGPVTPRPQSA
ncbi:unnamed protein product, partial [Gadus morhua 'NCC']